MSALTLEQPARPCHDTTTGPTGIQWLCIASLGPPPGAPPHEPHTHYYVRRYPPLDTTETR